jgi:hypothetical protein
MPVSAGTVQRFLETGASHLFLRESPPDSYYHAKAPMHA